ncbi:MAG: 2-hydroxy-6-oxo-6-phenylhexa-2,4-dienoate hydrolase [Pseudobutyrivibrio sp.]|nr:2-hydroxy-6-oxo-6-phenylhexa-2,4-dienoate hydrolase [Pseudobutyrivibrio sp.]
MSVTEKIEKYIQDNFNGTIDAAIGSSLGASFVGQLIQRKNIHINHGIFGSPDLDQCNRVLASIEGALFIPLLNSFTGSETKRKKTIRKLMTEMSMTENSAKRFVECIEKFSKTSMKNEFYTDLITYLDDDINVDNTKVHFIYASKMGEKYKRRYKKHFHNPEIKEFNMNHEQWLYGTDEYRLPVLKAIDDFII